MSAPKLRTGYGFAARFSSQGGFILLTAHRLKFAPQSVCFAILFVLGGALGCAGTHPGTGNTGGSSGNAGETGEGGDTGAGGNGGSGGETNNNPFGDGSSNTGGDTGTGGTTATGGTDGGGSDVPTGPVCGNGIKETGEECDDGDTAPGDGCDGTCHIEPNYTCPTAGEACVSTIVCGNGTVEGNEQCDDGNTTGGDGCTPSCTIQTGYTCPAKGGACTIIPPPPCGNGTVETGEKCDDGNTTPGDGCSATCTIENGYTCPATGGKCSKTPYCGDGIVNTTLGEQCDDGNTTPGDGCTGVCKLEPFYKCPTAGKPCVTTIVCGDLLVTGDEACDDGNTKAGDGCSADCKQVEGGYTCPTANGTGGACQPVAMPKCGDGALGFGEYCDDGNTASGDGCSSTCTVETGYTCPTAGQKCTLVTYCGDGVLTVADGEQCDDGNAVGGDGCSATCVIEANYACPTPGQKCVSTVVCGDGKVTGTEQCDDGNLVNGDGCTLGCELECGWTCPAGGRCRATKCGDGLVAGAEQCDDGNNVAGDGCSPTCTLESQPVTKAEGWTCSSPTAAGTTCIGPTTCKTTTCGNKIVEGSEQCDDMNHDMGDGCTPFCRLEPACPAGGGACGGVCGDGLLLPSEQADPTNCDDGNTVDGDGCSKNCKVEPGYQCQNLPIKPNPLILPIVFHDFKGWNEVGGHPDFECSMGAGEPGIAMGMLSTTNGGVPVHVNMCEPQTANLCTTTQHTCNPGTTVNTTYDDTIDWYGMWYTDNATYNIPIVQTLTLGAQVNGANSPAPPAATACNTGTNPDCTSFQFKQNGWYPIDGMGWGNGPNNHNFGFTSETRYWFEYEGSATLTFNGDDDVWVFINKKLAMDLGGLHQGSLTSMTLDPTDGKAYVCDFIAPGTTQAALNGCSSVNNTGGGHVVDLGLTIGGVYEIVVFQAERHTSASNYQLTLSKFSGVRSSCGPVCGDMIVTSGEACDLGKANNTGAYGGCNADCTLAPGCGDAKVNGGEQCDDGVNMSQYGGTTKQCAAGCVWAPYCGDAKIDGGHGETCDDGTANNTGAYGKCGTNCQLGPRCGDNVVNGPEGCDDGIHNGDSSSKCGADCQPKCGNGTLDAGEQCDNGKANNTGGYGKCNADCTLAARCGDGIKNGAEACDDGKNDGSYGTCAPGCVLGPRCGDGTVQTGAGELCDAGANNQPAATAYGKNVCTTRCLPAPYCGDKSVDSGEGCDDGVNSGQPGSCTTDCKSYVPLASCGDAITQAPEQCDDGTAKNGTTGDKCDIHCRFACGDGVKDTGEACDNGVNDGSYGTCNIDCTLAPHCGDGTVNGPEKCDNGANNSDTAYGPGSCTKSCTVGPYCGDGRIQTANGEECDGGQGCSNTCKRKIIM